MIVNAALSVDEQAELLRVLAHPLRLTILKELTGGERSVGDIAERTGLGLSALSQQLAILRKASLVSARREAKQVFYAIDAGQVGQVRAIIDVLVLGGPPAEPDRLSVPPPVDVRLGAAMFAKVSRVSHQAK